jgi:tetratricopeptide (TPR) repeat protein
MMLAKRTIATLVAVTAMVGTMTSVSAEGRVDEMSADVDSLGKDIQTLEARYINPDLLENRYEVESRLNEGRVFYILKDWYRASVIFLDLVSNKKIKGTPAQRDALFYLADSLFMQDNVIGARRRFNELLGVGAGEYYQDSVKRLIEIASLTDDFTNVENLYKAARSRAGAAARPELTYVYGKSLFFRKKNADALRAFRSIPKDSEVYLQSLYFQGVLLAKEGSEAKDKGKLKSALASFGKVLELAGPRPTDLRIIELVELTHMSIGRVYYELEEWELAVDQYQYIERDSSYFDRSLYEVTWCFIRRGDIKKAQRNLDILILSAPDSALTPEARLLRGDLMLQLEAYGDAVATYQEVIDDYEPVKSRLEQIMNRQGGAKAYFDALVGRDVGRAESVEVPAVVAAWVNNDPRMARTLGVAKDLDTGRADIEDSLEIISELEDAINSRSKVDIFPELKEGWGRGLEVQSQFVSKKKQLIAMEAKTVLASASKDGRSRYASAREERKRLQKGYDAIPKSRSELGTRERGVKRQYADLETALYRLGYEIDSQRAQLVAMDKWLEDRKARGDEVPAEEERTIRESMKRHYKLVEELEVDRAKLRKIVRRSKAQTGINDDVAETEEETKKEYQAALASERAVLRDLRGSLSAGDRASVERMDEVHARILRHEARLESYFGKLNKIVNRKVDEIRRELDGERVRVAQYAEELNIYSGDSDSLAGDIAQNNFRRVEERFDDIILKADVGIIDVAWKRKEDRTARIRQLFDHKANDLETLDRNFRGVLEEEDE